MILSVNCNTLLHLSGLKEYEFKKGIILHLLFKVKTFNVMQKRLPCSLFETLIVILLLLS